MCGILFTNFDNYKKNLKALDSSSFRGPDQSNFRKIKEYFFGFNYLSITGIFKSALQPYEYKKNILLFNGEIYNYKDLLSFLPESFKQRNYSDTEILAAMLSENGFEKTLQKLEGMWSIIYFENKTNKIYISRDRIGIKPLFYYQKGKKFIFSSDINGINIIIKDKKLNLDQAKNFLKTGALNVSCETFFKNIKIFPPATYAVISGKKNKINFYKYWNITFSEKLNSNDIPNLKIIVKKQILKHLNCNIEKKIGLPLSSGLDSNFLLNNFHHFKNLICYTLKNVDNNENIAVKKIYNKKIKKKKFKIVEIDCKEANSVKFVNEYISKLDQPIRSYQHVYQYLLRKKAKKDGVRVLISGDGADEIFAGYEYCKPYYLISLIKMKKNIDVLKFLKNFNGFELFKLKKDIKSILTKKNSKEVTLKSFLINRLLKTHIPYWLHIDDMNSMLNSIENRVPFLDHKILETVMKFKTSLFLKDGKTKYLLRKIYPKTLLRKISSKKLHKPGNSNIIFNQLSKDFIKNLSYKKFNKLFNYKKIINYYLIDKKNKLLNRNSDYWLRYYFFAKWINLNNIRI